MNNKINIAEILKDAPVGLELYSPIFGKCTFLQINNDKSIKISTDYLEWTISFDKFGCFYTNFVGSECLLFPSKEQRDWSKFTLPRRDLPHLTPVMCNTNILKGWVLRYYASEGWVYINGNKEMITTSFFSYIIPVKDFNFENPNECLDKAFKY